MVCHYTHTNLRIPGTPQSSTFDRFLPGCPVIIRGTTRRVRIAQCSDASRGVRSSCLGCQAAGCAVVIPDVYSVPEVRIDATVLCDPDDTDVNFREIERLLSDPDALRNIAERSIERSKQFSWERTAGETLDVYRSVLSRGTGRRGGS